MTDITEPATDPFLESMTAFADTLSALAEMATGFRRQLEDSGWSPAVAEQCAGLVLFTNVQACLRGADLK